jgi:hypothetical protein
MQQATQGWTGTRMEIQTNKYNEILSQETGPGQDRSELYMKRQPEKHAFVIHAQYNKDTARIGTP